MEHISGSVNLSRDVTQVQGKKKYCNKRSRSIIPKPVAHQLTNAKIQFYGTNRGNSNEWHIHGIYKCRHVPSSLP